MQHWGLSFRHCSLPPPPQIVETLRSGQQKLTIFQREIPRLYIDSSSLKLPHDTEPRTEKFSAESREPQPRRWSRAADCLGSVKAMYVRGLLPKCSHTLIPRSGKTYVLRQATLATVIVNHIRAHGFRNVVFIMEPTHHF